MSENRWAYVRIQAGVWTTSQSPRRRRGLSEYGCKKKHMSLAVWSDVANRVFDSEAAAVGRKKREEKKKNDRQ